MREIEIHEWRADANDDAVNMPEGSTGQKHAGRVLALIASGTLLVEALRDARSWMVRTRVRTKFEPESGYRREHARVSKAIDEALKPYDEEVKRG